MEENKKIIIAQRVKKPLLKEAILFMPMVFVSLLAIIVIPIMNLFLREVLLGFIQLNYVLIICVCAGFIIIGTCVAILTIKNNIKFNELPIDCLVFEDDLFYIYGNTELIIEKKQIISFKVKEEKIKLGLSRKPSKVGNLVFLVMIDNESKKITLSHIYNVKCVKALLDDILKDIVIQENSLNEENNTEYLENNTENFNNITNSNIDENEIKSIDPKIEEDLEINKNKDINNNEIDNQ